MAMLVMMGVMIIMNVIITVNGVISIIISSIMIYNYDYYSTSNKYICIMSRIFYCYYYY